MIKSPAANKLQYDAEKLRANKKDRVGQINGDFVEFSGRKLHNHGYNGECTETIGTKEKYEGNRYLIDDEYKTKEYR